MSQRVFNNCTINGTTIAIAGFVAGSGEVDLIGKDVEYTTDDHVMHNLRTNIYSNAKFEAFGDQSDLNTDPDSDVFGGTHVFYMDTTVVATFDGVVTATYSEDKTATSVEIRGESEDA